MPERKPSFVLRGVLGVIAVTSVLTASAWTATTYKILYRFKGSPDGAVPFAGLTLDQAGSLYGTTGEGGAYSRGTVFKLTPNANGIWTERLLYSFCSLANCIDGSGPESGLIFDTAGNLYGTTLGGGAAGLGTVFELKPNANGNWTERVLHSFGGGTDGDSPYAGLIFDVAGNLYGTTYYGGVVGAGTVFELKPNANGTWTESVLYSFSGSDGSNPYAGLTIDMAGNLYGTTLVGDAGGYGNVFELTPNLDGSWTESTLHVFSLSSDGGEPNGVTVGAAGTLYGTTFVGGAYDRGTVFALSSTSDGTWTLNVLHAFLSQPAEYPSASLIFDTEGNIYGTTSNGGHLDCAPYCGTAFKLNFQANGTWKYSVLCDFKGDPAMDPIDSLALDKANNLYGTTSLCGSSEPCQGVIFEILP